MAVLVCEPPRGKDFLIYQWYGTMRQMWWTYNALMWLASLHKVPKTQHEIIWRR